MNQIQIITQILEQMNFLGSQINKSITESELDCQSDRFCELTILQFRICITIDKLKSVKMSDLAKELGLKTPSVTQVVDKLEDQKMLERQEDPSDRRSIKVQLTQFGQSKIDTIKHAHESFLINKFQVLSGDELVALLAIFHKLNHKTQL